LAASDVAQRTRVHRVMEDKEDERERERERERDGEDDVARERRMGCD